jgi:hypothetical protein
MARKITFVDLTSFTCPALITQAGKFFTIVQVFACSAMAWVTQAWINNVTLWTSPANITDAFESFVILSA